LNWRNSDTPASAHLFALQTCCMHLDVRRVNRASYLLGLRWWDLQIARDKLVALGTCIGKLTHTGKFRLTIGALDILSQHAKYKVCMEVQCAWCALLRCVLKACLSVNALRSSLCEVRPLTQHGCWYVLYHAEFLGSAVRASHHEWDDSQRIAFAGQDAMPPHSRPGETQCLHYLRCLPLATRRSGSSRLARCNFCTATTS
jgi:hypothetical protein